jgi:hypothetical protein
MTKFAVAVSSVKMQFSHDKHQYYFEKYLRNEMEGEELASFEAKLVDNESLKNSFEYYKANRQKIVAEELAEYDADEILKPKPQKGGWVFTAISLLCLVLIVDYFLSANYSESLSENKARKPFIETIKIFKSKENIKISIDTIKDVIKKTTALALKEEYREDSSLQIVAIDSQFNQYLRSNSSNIQGDYFVTDSLFKVLEGSQIIESRNAMRIKTDSLLDDSTINVLVMKGFFKNASLISRQLLVEFWGSPIHFRGYLFNGKKLVIYGFDPNSPVYLSYMSENNTYHIYIGNKEFHLFPDSQFHKLVFE